MGIRFWKKEKSHNHQWSWRVEDHQLSITLCLYHQQRMVLPFTVTAYWRVIQIASPCFVQIESRKK